MNSKTSKNLIGNIILLSYLLLILIFYRFSFGTLLDKFLIAVINGLGVLGLLLYWKVLRRKEIFLLTVILIISGTFSFFLIKNMSIISYLTLFRYLGIVFILLSIDIDIKWVQGLMAITLLVFMPVFFHEIGYNLFVRNSQNYHSIILLLITFIYNLSYWQKNKKAPLLPTIFAITISFLSGGRGPFISFVFFLLGTIITNYRKETRVNTRKKPHYLSSGIGVLIILLTLNNYMLHNKMELLAFPIEAIVKDRIIENQEHPQEPLDNFQERNSNEIDSQNESKLKPIQSRPNEKMLFESGLVSNARVNIIKRYYQGITSDPIYFFLGYPLREIKYLGRFNFNPHNSYLRLHANFGLIASIAIMGLLLFAFIKMLMNRQYGMVFILTAFLFRILTDIAAFPGNLDVPIFYIIFNNLKTSQLASILNVSKGVYNKQ